MSEVKLSKHISQTEVIFSRCFELLFAYTALPNSVTLWIVFVVSLLS